MNTCTVLACWVLCFHRAVMIEPVMSYFTQNMQALDLLYI